MNELDANRTTPRYELKDELARFCLPGANRDPNLKLAWVNSVCILFLVIGIFGARRGLIEIKPVPPIEEIVPVVVEPITLPPHATTEKKENPDDEKPDATPVAVVIPQAPNISFSVPTIGGLVVPAALAAAPPLEPLRTQAQIDSINSTGSGGERPQPPYPPIALAEGEQGTVPVLLTSDGSGHIVSIELKSSCGYPILDHSTLEFLKRHWTLPTGGSNQIFQTSITYKLQLN